MILGTNFNSQYANQTYRIYFCPFFSFPCYKKNVAASASFSCSCVSNSNIRHRLVFLKAYADLCNFDGRIAVRILNEARVECNNDETYTSIPISR